MKEVGLQITRARAEKGWTPSELAGKVHMPAATIMQMEDGSERASIEELVKIAKALGLTVHVSFKKQEPEDDGGQAMTAQDPQGVTGPRGPDDSGLSSGYRRLHDEDDYDPRS